MSYQTDKQIEEEGLAVREAFGIADQHRPDIKRMIYKAKQLGLIVDYVRGIDPRLNAHAAFDGNRKMLHVSEDTFCALDLHDTHANFTIVHELMHAWRGDAGLRRRSLAVEREIQANRGVEAGTNRLAAAVLAPYHLANYRPGMVPRDLCELFGISLSNASIRLPVIEKLYRQANGIRRALPPEVEKFLKGK
jgi:Zn-dependent peptidase ImmA (M78 family)